MRNLAFSLLLMIVLAIPTVSFAKVCTSGGVGISGNSSGQTSSAFGFNISGGDSCSNGGYFGSNFDPTGLGLPTGTVYGIIATILVWLLMLFGFLGILGFVISGIMYIISAGNDDLSKQAKKGMLNSIIGIIVGLSGYIVMQLVSGILGGQGGVNY